MARTTRLRESRFELMSTLLSWEGELRNGRLQELLGITSVQASRLIAQFRDKFPALLENDAAQKRWVATAEVSAAGGLDRYLATLDAREPWLEDGRIGFLIPDHAVFAALRAACLAGSGVEVTYASLAHPKGLRRALYPHTMVRLSQRWHVRAWCMQRSDYADFTLGRMLRIRSHAGPSPALPPDVDWNQSVDVRLGAHSALNLEHEQVVRAEYFAGAAARRLTVRAALVNYIINDIHAAIDPTRQLPPEYLLEVLNVDELKPYLFLRPRAME